MKKLSRKKKERSSGSPEEAPKRSPPDEPLWKGYLSLLIRAVVFIAILVLLFTQILFLKRVDGNEMFPALKDGDLALGFRLERTLRSGDVVLYQADGTLHFGRILTLGGNTVEISGDGSVKINGVSESGEILFSTDDPGKLTYPYEVPEGSVFILGDYRTETKDSRTFGAIPISSIKGKVLTILRRRGI
ncbi:MAG: signal peptidase I [Chordicoccus sp.]